MLLHVDHGGVLAPIPFPLIHAMHNIRKSFIKDVLKHVVLYFLVDLLFCFSHLYFGRGEPRISSVVLRMYPQKSTSLGK